jgi:hypothetical protein
MVRVIVPFAPGGPADIVARLLTQKLGEHLGRQFFVENVAGAGGNLGMRAAARASSIHTIGSGYRRMRRSRFYEGFFLGLIDHFVMAVTAGQAPVKV